MKKLSGTGIKVLKIVHLIFAFMWFVGALGIMLLLTTLSTQESHELYMRSLATKRLDDLLIIPGALGCLLTGIIYGIWTNWGFFKHRWLTIKWILTVAAVLFGTFIMGPWVDGNIYEDVAKYTMDNSEFFSNVHNTIVWGGVQIFALLFLIAISVLKPWRSKM